MTGDPGGWLITDRPFGIRIRPGIEQHRAQHNALGRARCVAPRRVTPGEQDKGTTAENDALEVWSNPHLQCAAALPLGRPSLALCELSFGAFHHDVGGFVRPAPMCTLP